VDISNSLREEREPGGAGDRRSGRPLFHGIRRAKKEEDRKRSRRGAGVGGGRDSPPVAKGGLLTNPAINLNTQNPAKLSTSAVGI